MLARVSLVENVAPGPTKDVEVLVILVNSLSYVVMQLICLCLILDIIQNKFVNFQSDLKLSMHAWKQFLLNL